MPSWLLLILSIAGCIVLTGLLAAGATGDWRTLWVAMRQFSLMLLGMAVPAILVGAGLFIWG